MRFNIFSKHRKMASNQVILILGAGPRVGTAVAKAFEKNGYKIVLASRRGTDSKTPEGYLSLKADFDHPSAVEKLFQKVNSELGTFPNVVAYNAAAMTPPSDQNNPLSIPASGLDANLNVNTISAYVAMQEAVKGWETLPGDVKKTFIYTGNITNRKIVPMPMTLSLSVGKSATSYIVGYADTMYRSKGYR